MTGILNFIGISIFDEMKKIKNISNKPKNSTEMSSQCLTCKDLSSRQLATSLYFLKYVSMSLFLDIFFQNLLDTYLRCWYRDTCIGFRERQKRRKYSFHGELVMLWLFSKATLENCTSYGNTCAVNICRQPFVSRTIQSCHKQELGSSSLVLG